MVDAKQIPAIARQQADEFVGRGWVLGEVEDWRLRRPERYLIISGEPGSGKTALAAWLARLGPPPDDRRLRHLRAVLDEYVAL